MQHNTQFLWKWGSTKEWGGGGGGKAEGQNFVTSEKREILKTW